MPGDFFPSSLSKIKTALDFPARTVLIQGAHKQNVNGRSTNIYQVQLPNPAEITNFAVQRLFLCHQAVAFPFGKQCEDHQMTVNMIQCA
jgi:hypothetical protein